MAKHPFNPSKGQKRVISLLYLHFATADCFLYCRSCTMYWRTWSGTGSNSTNNEATNERQVTKEVTSWCFITSANKVRIANLDPCDKRCKLIFSFHLAFRLKTYLKKLELKTKHKEQKRKEPTKDNSLFLISLCEYSKVKKQWSNKGKRMNKYIKYGLLVFI